MIFFHLKPLFFKTIAFYYQSIPFQVKKCTLPNEKQYFALYEAIMVLYVDDLKFCFETIQFTSYVDYSGDHTRNNIRRLEKVPET